jgi:hypothetical protein
MLYDYEWSGTVGDSPTEYRFQGILRYSPSHFPSNPRYFPAHFAGPGDSGPAVEVGAATFPAGFDPGSVTVAVALRDPAQVSVEMMRSDGSLKLIEGSEVDSEIFHDSSGGSYLWLWLGPASPGRPIMIIWKIVEYQFIE